MNKNGSKNVDLPENAVLKWETEKAVNEYGIFKEKGRQLSGVVVSG